MEVKKVHFPELEAQEHEDPGLEAALSRAQEALVTLVLLLPDHADDLVAAVPHAVNPDLAGPGVVSAVATEPADLEEAFACLRDFA